MIEVHFRRGVRYLWNKPADVGGVMDGAVVPSMRPATNLTYDGLDGHRAALDPALLVGHVNVLLGLAMGANVPYTWLDYALGRTARLGVGGNDILTGYMSGCLIIRGTYNGAMSVFHVGTIVGNPAVNATVRSEFAKVLPADATGFNPAGAWTYGELAAIQANLGGNAIPRIVALVTAAGVFHSVAMFDVRQDNSWTNPTGRRYMCVGGIKQVPSMTRVRLMAKLMS